MKQKLIISFIILSYFLTEDSSLNYLWPTNTSKTITTLFGEKRSRRFHAGIDVRTYGRIGDKIFAVESGYISRIKISPDGYGKALYLTLDDGNIILYAHIDRYNSEIELLVNKLRINKKSSSLNHFLKKDELRVQKGELLGYCGDTGSLSGPHLHFEIRDPSGHPINPLKNFYSIVDTLRPIAESLAIIPLSNKTYINGLQKYNLFDIEPLIVNNDNNSYKYFIKDTISVIGKFGLGLETHDEINSSPFDFGIYEIELFIDNQKQYKINFDKYCFDHDHLIYNELDYYLLEKESRSFHRLFLNENTELDFIDRDSNEGITLDKGYHNLIINVIDNFDNSIQIQGVLKGDIVLSPDIIYDNNNYLIQTSNTNNNLSFYLSTRYENSQKIIPNYKQLDSTLFSFDKPLKPYEVLEIFNKDKGIKSKSTYISFYDYNPYKISGTFELEHINRYININFKENEFSGFNAKLLLSGNGKKNIIDLNRYSKNVLSSGLIELNRFEDINQISIIYDTNPEIIFNKNLYGKIFSSEQESSLKFKNFEIISNKESFNFDSFISIHEDQIDIPKEFIKISNPIIISPNTISFKDYITLKYENTKLIKGGIYQLNEEKEKWIFKGKINSFGQAEIKLFSGGIFCILDEEEKPLIKNIFPNPNSYYNVKEVDKINFSILDVHSKIDYDSIEINLNNQPIYFDYIPYRDLLRADLFNELDSGENILKISIKDNIGNKTNKEIRFFIK